MADLSSLSDEQLMGLLSQSQQMAPMRAPSAPSVQTLSDDQLMQALQGFSSEKPSLISEFGSGAMQGVKDIPKTIASIPSGLKHLSGDLFNAITSPVESLSSGATERTLRGVGGMAAGIAGAKALGAGGAALGSFAGPIGTGVGGLLGAGLGFGLGTLGFNKVNQLTGSDNKTELSDDVRNLGYDTAQGLVMDGALKAAQKTAGGVKNWLADVAPELDRKSLGAQYGDYKKTANQLQSVELPDGQIQSLTKRSLDQFLKEEKFPVTRNPEMILDRVLKRSRAVSDEIGKVIDNYDNSGKAAPQVKFKNALNLLEKGRIPVDKVDSYLSRLTELEEGIKREGGGKLAYLQQQKIALGDSWNPADSGLNKFNRALYTDIKKAIESATPEVKGLNQQLQKYKVIQPIAERALSVAEGSDPISRAINIGKTTGGFGLPIALSTYALGPVAGPALGYAVGKGLSAIDGKAALAKGARGGSSIARGVEATVNALPPGVLPGLDDLAYSEKENQKKNLREDTQRQPQQKTEAAQKVGSMSQPRKNQINVPSDNDETPSEASQRSKSIRDISTITSNLSPFIQAVIEVESAGKPNARSPKGARGLMQIMPEHYKRLGITDPEDAAQSIKGGTQILQEELERFGDPKLALAAYNAGSPRVIKAISKAGSDSFERIYPYLPKETQQYVAKVLAAYKKRAQSQEV